MQKLPDEFVRRMLELLGSERWAVVEAAIAAGKCPVSIRLNAQKMGEGVIPPDADCTVPWCRDGWYLSHRPAFTFDPLLHAGAYYVQEASSMFLNHVLRQFVHEPVQMLDLCAAPGGKSTAARAALPEGSLLVSNEPVKLRAQILAENLQKWGHEDVIVTNSYPRDFRKSGLLFDVILADVPCSGEGMFRKDESAIREWSEGNVEHCWRLQREIVSEAWQCLKPGGLFVYSTCTFNVQEDEENVRWLCEQGGELLSVPVEPSWQITGSLMAGFEGPVYRFIPGFSRGEGLFMAVLRKQGNGFGGSSESGITHAKPKKLAKQGKLKKSGKSDLGQLLKAGLPQDFINIPLKEASALVSSAEQFALRTLRMGDQREVCMAIPTHWADVFDDAVSSLHVIHGGVCIGEWKGSSIVPAAALALSRCLRRDAFPQIDVDYEKAIAYLRREALVLPDGTPRGFVLLTYRHLPIGFVKNLGTRANNLFPAEWRIRSTRIDN